MKIADPELLLFAGGECLEKYGTLFKRVRPEGEALEVVTAPETRYFRDRQDVIRAAGVGVPTVDWQDYDGTGRRPVLVMERGETQLCEFSVPGGTPADWELQVLDGVTNLSSEFALQVDVGDNVKYALPANFNPNDFALSSWVIPGFDAADGEHHYAVLLYKDASNFIYLRKSSANVWHLVPVVAGTSVGVSKAATFSAGSERFLGARVSGGTIYLYTDTDDDGTLEVQSTAMPGSFAVTTGWSAWVGSDQGTIRHFEGAVNLLVTDDGSSADPITDRFNAGAGLDIQEYLASVHAGSGLTYGEELVSYLPKSKDGSEIKIVSFDGASQKVINTGFETDVTNWTTFSSATVVQSAAQAKAGTKSALVDPVTQSGGIRGNSAAMTVGRWALAKASIYPLVDAATAFLSNWTGLTGLSQACTVVGAWNDLAQVVEIDVTPGTMTVRRVSDVGLNDFYTDELYVYEFTEPAFSVFTKGSAFPMLDGFGGPSGVADAALEASPSAVVPVAYDSALGTNVTRLDTGPAGTNARSYRFGLPGQLNGLTPGSWVSMALGVFIPSSEAITPASVTVAVVDTAGETVGTAAASKGAWNELYVSHQVDAGAAEAYLELRVHDGVALGTVDESLYFRTPTIVGARCQPRPFANAAEGSVAMSAEKVSRSWTFPPIHSDGYTIYLKTRERGTIHGSGTEVLFHFGDPASANTFPRLAILHAGGVYEGTIGLTAGSKNSDLSAATPAMGEGFEVALRVFPDGSVQLLGRVDGGATETAAKSAAPALEDLPTSWAEDSVNLLGGGPDALQGFAGLLAAKIVIGTDWDLDQLEAAETLPETGV